MVDERELSPRFSYTFANESRLEVEDDRKDSSTMAVDVDRQSLVESIASQLSSTKSASESIFRFIEENGRTYHSHSAGSYYLPNDQLEIDRLDLQFYVYRIILQNKDFCAPLTNPRSILDIGTGTGKWAIEMADRFPDAEILGTDLSPIQPEWNPPNVSFLVDDANEEDWGSQRYDYIHTRMLLGAFEHFETIIKRSFEYLEPGGYMESQELWPRVYCNDDDDDDEDENGQSFPAPVPGTSSCEKHQTSDSRAVDPSTNKFVEWLSHLSTAARQVHRPLEIATSLKQQYISAGFEDVHELILKLPIGPWPKDPQFKLVGKFWQQVLHDGLQGLCLAFFHRAFGWSLEEIEVYLVEVRRALLKLGVSDAGNAGEGKGKDMYMRFYVVWGRKPERAGSDGGD